MSPQSFHTIRSLLDVLGLQYPAHHEFEIAPEDREYPDEDADELFELWHLWPLNGVDGRVRGSTSSAENPVRSRALTGPRDPFLTDPIASAIHSPARTRCRSSTASRSVHECR